MIKRMWQFISSFFHEVVLFIADGCILEINDSRPIVSMTQIFPKPNPKDVPLVLIREFQGTQIFIDAEVLYENACLRYIVYQRKGKTNSKIERIDPDQIPDDKKLADVDFSVFEEFSMLDQ